MKKIVVLISGRGSNFVAIEETALREAWSRTIGAQIVAVISNRPEAKGLLLAKEYGIEEKRVREIVEQNKNSYIQNLLEKKVRTFLESKAA